MNSVVQIKTRKDRLNLFGLHIFLYTVLKDIMVIYNAFMQKLLYLEILTGIIQRPSTIADVKII